MYQTSRCNSIVVIASRRIAPAEAPLGVRNYHPQQPLVGHSSAHLNQCLHIVEYVHKHNVPFHHAASSSHVVSTVHKSGQFLIILTSNTTGRLLLSFIIRPAINTEIFLREKTSVEYGPSALTKFLRLISNFSNLLSMSVITFRNRSAIVLISK